jgi:RHH-type proline utilization regulon transcriptional repressor/proline dehydrogenase/delta 1-pyrroline-5-carboxylate dehydrogenase
MSRARQSSQSHVLPVFSAPYAAPDEPLAAALLDTAPREAAAEARIDKRATRLVEAIRQKSGGLGGIEDFLQEYSLSTPEGLALMLLAEALLRVPDSGTADRLIEDKLSSGDWTHHEVKSSALLVSASAWALGISARIIQPGETPENILESLGKRLGLPAVRGATRQAMRLLGSHFVLGQDIEEALSRAAGHRAFRYSYDMLGEGARTAKDAERYFQSYARAIEADGRQCAAPRAAGHFGQAFGAASALRGDLARARFARADAACARTRAAGQTA